MTTKIRAAVIGYGNVGRYALEALETHDDFETVAIVDPVVGQTTNCVDGIPLFQKVADAPEFDVALLCVPTRLVERTATEILKMGKPTADIFDIHGDELLKLYKSLDATAKENNTAALISAGWDPGIDSVFRTLLAVMIPHGITYTNFGPGMSMGHSVAARAIPGVKDAVSLTYPKGAGVHRRMVYIIPEEGACNQEIEAELKKDEYFAHDEIHVFFVKSLDNYRDFGHGALIERKGRAGKHYNQRASVNIAINNPAVTSQCLVMAARAIVKQRPGCYTMSMVPPADYLPLTTEEVVHDLT